MQMLTPPTATMLSAIQPLHESLGAHGALALACSTCCLLSDFSTKRVFILHIHCFVGPNLHSNTMAPVIFASPPSDVTLAKSSKQMTNGASGQKTLSTPLPNPSLQVTADHKLKQENAPVYAPGYGEVLLHIKATGVCGYVRTNGRALRMFMRIAGPTFTSGAPAG